MGKSDGGVLTKSEIAKRVEKILGVMDNMDDDKAHEMLKELLDDIRREING